MAKGAIPGGTPAEDIATSATGAGAPGTLQIPWSVIAKPDTDELVDQAVAFARGLPVQDVFTGGTAPAQKVVTTAGTPVQLVAASTPCKQVVLLGLPLNTGRVVVGLDNTCRAADATFKAIAVVYAETPVVISAADANLLWLDATVSGEGVSWAPLT